MQAARNEGIWGACSRLWCWQQRLAILQSAGADCGAASKRFAAGHDHGSALGAGHHGRIGLLVGEPGAAEQQSQRRADDGTTQAETSTRRFHAEHATAKVGEVSRTFLEAWAKL